MHRFCLGDQQGTLRRRHTQICRRIAGNGNDHQIAPVCHHLIEQLAGLKAIDRRGVEPLQGCARVPRDDRFRKADDMLIARRPE